MIFKWKPNTICVYYFAQTDQIDLASRFDLFIKVFTVQFTYDNQKGLVSTYVFAGNACLRSKRIHINPFNP